MKKSMRSYLNQFAILVCVMILIVSYQNCSAGFQSAGISESASSLGNGNADLPPPSPSPPTIPEPEVPVEPGQALLKVARSGNGVVTSMPTGIACGHDCNEAFLLNTSITLVATADTGYIFKGWGGACSGTSLTCTVAMSEIKNVTVNFESTTPATGNIDAVIASMPSNSWKSLANTQMKDICPLPYNYYACRNVILAWSGGAYDEKRDRMMIFGGGHDDSWYNNLFSFDLVSMKWQRLTEMPAGAGDPAPPGWRDLRLETCGYYPKAPLVLPADFQLTPTGYIPREKCFSEPVVSQLDFQQPRSGHTYGEVFFDRVNDRFCSIAGTYYPSAQASSPVVVCFDPIAGHWIRAADRPGNIGGRGQTAIDSNGHIWAVAAEGADMASYDPVANAWKIHGYNNHNAGGGTDIDRKRDQLYSLVPISQVNYVLRKWDLTNPASLKPEKNYTEVTTTGDIPMSLGSRPGYVYADDKDRFFVWGGGRDIYILDPASREWKRMAATGDDPGPQQEWGTFGRFRYSPKRGVFVLVNSTTQNVFIYKP